MSQDAKHDELWSQQWGPADMERERLALIATFGGDPNGVTPWDMFAAATISDPQIIHAEDAAKVADELMSLRNERIERAKRGG